MNREKNNRSPVVRVIGGIPHRLQLAGGWIDRPFVSRRNPESSGSMVMVQIEPNFPPMDRSGIASGMRTVAKRNSHGKLPKRPREKLVKELYEVENKRKAQPGGWQDMIGLIYFVINRLDYNFKIHGGIFPAHIESCNSPATARWLEKVLHLIAVEPRPEGCNPLA